MRLEKFMVLLLYLVVAGLLSYGLAKTWPQTDFPIKGVL